MESKTTFGIDISWLQSGFTKEIIKGIQEHRVMSISSHHLKTASPKPPWA